MHEGKIHLTLRNPEDQDTLSLAALSTRQVLGGAAAPAPTSHAPSHVRRAAEPKPVAAKPAAPAPAPEPYKVSVIRGTKATESTPTQK
jgi:hypothetical protein